MESDANMKLNLDVDRIRLRICEAELERLVSDAAIEQAWVCPDGTVAYCVLELAARTHAADCSGDLMRLRVVLPQEAFLAFAAERPRRDGYTFTQGRLRIDVEVDVRDSHRRSMAIRAATDS
jgi:hypothetical protein